MRALLAALIASLALLAAVPAAHAANVALFNDNAFVGTPEANNLQSVLLSQGHTVFTFTDESAAGITTALDGRSVLLIPDLAGATDLSSSLSPSAREVIRQFVENGGGFVISGRATGDEATALINTLFNFELSESSTGNPAARNQTAAGTEFAAGPDTLPSNNTTSGIDIGVFPAGGNQIYVSAGHVHVGVLYRGRGSITYLGWDWNNSNPPSPGGQDNGWQGILNSAVGQPTVNAGDVGVSEGNAGVTLARFPLTLAGGPVSEEVQVTFELAGGNATAGSDYVVPGTTVSIPRGQTQVLVDVPVLGDRSDEPDETFELRVTSVAGAATGRATAVGTIGDDDPSSGRCTNRQNANDTGDTLVGTPFGDLLVGGNGNDTLRGGRGADCLRARAGNDVLSGGDDNDSLSGEAGNDRLVGGNGNDTLSGGNNADSLSAGAGNDRLGGGAGNDSMSGGRGLNTYSGGSGNDSINARNGRRETVDCGSGRRDRVTADASDTVRSCETVNRP